MTPLWFLWELTINTLEGLIFVFFLTKQLDYTKSDRQKIWLGFVALVSLLTTLNFFFISPLIVSLLMAVADITYALFTFQYHNTKGMCVFWGSSSAIIALISNNIVNNIAARAASFPDTGSLTQGIFRFEMMCLYILIYTTLFLVLYYFSKNRGNISLSFNARLLMIVFILVGIVSAKLTSDITLLTNSNQVIFLTAIITGILFVIIIFTMILFEYLGVLHENNLQLKLSVQQQKNEAAAYQSMKENYQEIREWKHDYHNHLLVMNNYLKNQQHDQLQSYLGELNQAWGEIRQFANTGNSALDALIYNKMLIAKEYDIPFNYQIIINQPLAISDINLCSIMGNLLDNALEASINASKSLRNKCFVDLKIDTQKHMILICISNFYSNNLVYKDGKFATLKQNLTAHGIGLSRVEKLLQQENGFLNLNVDKQIFTAEVLLPVKEDTA